jgi:hypothetical protein
MKFWEYLSICKSISVKCGIFQEEELSHLSYWKEKREVKHKDVTLCMICFIDPELKPREYANTDADVTFFSHSFSDCIANEKHGIISLLFLSDSSTRKEIPQGWCEALRPKGVFRHRQGRTADRNAPVLCA